MRLEALLLFAGLAVSGAAADEVRHDQPPTEAGPFKKTDLVELVTLDPTIRLDIRYATPHNFTGRPVYDEARAFLQRPAAEALVRAHQALAKDGLGILVFDGYRPWRVTKLFWDVTPVEKHDFVADPAQGSRHNRGCAADVSLFDLKTGREIPMPSPYDDFTDKAAPFYPGGTAEERAARGLLRQAMEKEGFEVFAHEWWHFDFHGWKDYALSDVPFAALR